MSRDMTKTTKWVCAQRRLRSAWASPQSDQSLRCTHEKIWVLTYPLSAQQRLWSDWVDARRIWVFAGRTLILLALSCHGSYYEFSEEWARAQETLQNDMWTKISLLISIYSCLCSVGSQSLKLLQADTDNWSDGALFTVVYPLISHLYKTTIS